MYFPLLWEAEFVCHRSHCFQNDERTFSFQGKLSIWIRKLEVGGFEKDFVSLLESGHSSTNIHCHSSCYLVIGSDGVFLALLEFQKALFCGWVFYLGSDSSYSFWLVSVQKFEWGLASRSMCPLIVCKLPGWEELSPFGWVICTIYPKV